jgi:queuine tRNA-ribosyltransferase
VSALTFSIMHRSASSNARTGVIDTPHGTFHTPAFMPVGTRASVKGVMPDALRGLGAEIILGNAYHLMLRPGAELIDELGGLHKFMRWDRPILTDSGGYQAFSMADINKVSDDGVTFRSIIDGAQVHLSPERAIEVQNMLGADIIMAFDDCAGAEAGPEGIKASGHPDNEQKEIGPAKRVRVKPPDYARRLGEAHERTVRWLERCKASHRRPETQALFGIVQGGTDLDLRAASIEAICNIELPGYAIGGVAVGETPEQIRAVVEFTAPRMPADKPRYLMGVGYERDIVAAVRAGVDMFDCVLPTRNGRNANAFAPAGRVHLRNARYRADTAVLDHTCDCPACSGGFSRAYLRHLFMAGEMLGPILVSMHNIRHYQRLMLDIREAIREDSWSLLQTRWPVLGQRSQGGLLGSDASS